MARVQCVTCSGVYDTVFRDGTRYFHACPPILNRTTGAVTERPDKRDENIDMTKVREGDPRQPDEDRIRSAGRGVRRAP